VIPLKALQLKIKYALDGTVAFLMLVVLMPLFGIIALLIRLDDGGPVFFRQKRLGLHGELFEIWKFRTMVVDADRFLGQHGEVKAANRITRVGQILRRSSLDELPQIINIVKGEMSFVGPRAALPEHWPRYTARQKERARVRPGITGLAQVKGRNTLKWSQRIVYDNEYIETYSLWLDFVIALKTIKVIVMREGIVIDRNPGDVDDLAPIGTSPE
jgi:lipopolysaccharide/colanic/teichoic acid biosynthesis glycosyltransferase